MPPIPSFSDQQLQEICNILAETSDGLTGSEIGQLLAQCDIEDLAPGITKRERLFQALSHKQNQDKCSNNIVLFLHASMNPVRYVQKQALFYSRKGLLNQVLIFAGYKLGDDGKLHLEIAAKNLSEAQARAGHLRSELQRRSVHPDVIKFCQIELLQENYFHAVLEATKSIGHKIRIKTGLTTDGAYLVDQAFGINNGPKLVFNTLQTDSEKSEHTGYMNLMKGIFGLIRNPTAHSPKIDWPIKEQDALDLLTTLSYIHRRLDEVVSTGK